jgi:methionyl-tRNA formyltransferase
MKIAFFGVTQHSYDLLEELLRNKFDICVICTTSPKFHISYSAKSIKVYNYADLKKLGCKYSIPVIVIKDKMSAYRLKIKSFSPDLILAAGWYFMIPASIRSFANLGCLGIHASLLPKYAGGAPLVWALINGEKKAGVSLFYLDRGVDTGDIAAQRRITITSADDIDTLYKKVTVASKKMLVKALPKIKNGTIKRSKQNLRLRTVYPQRNPDDGLIDWAQSSEEIRNFIRAQTRPYPGAFCYTDSRKLKIWKADTFIFKKTFDVKPGTVVGISSGTFTVKCGKGYLKVKDFEQTFLDLKIGQELNCERKR